MSSLQSKIQIEQREAADSHIWDAWTKKNIWHFCLIHFSNNESVIKNIIYQCKAELQTGETAKFVEPPDLLRTQK